MRRTLSSARGRRRDPGVAAAAALARRRLDPSALRAAVWIEDNVRPGLRMTPLRGCFSPVSQDDVQRTRHQAPSPPSPRLPPRKAPMPTPDYTVADYLAA